MKTLRSMTSEDRIEELLRICHGITVEEVAAALQVYHTAKDNPYTKGLEPFKEVLSRIRKEFLS